MTPLDIDTALDWRGRTVVDRHGEKIGTFEELYLDESDRPAWAAVKTGLFGLRHTFVPLSAAQPAGDSLQVPFDKDHVKDAPNVDPDAQLSADEERALFRHYGTGEEDGGRDPDASGGGERPAPEEAGDRAASPAGAEADRSEPDRSEPDRTAPARDDDERAEPPRAEEERAETPRAEEGAEMIRSEEEVSVGKRRRATGRARLKKYVVTEHVQKTVPVQREKVAVELDPADDEDARAEPPPQR
jgi:stress response protein YsnF